MMNRRMFGRGLAGALLAPLVLAAAAETATAVSAPEPPDAPLESDPDVQRYAHADHGDSMVPVTIWFNGVKREHVLSYDLDTQCILVYAEDENGKLIRHRDGCKIAAHFGHVVVKWDAERFATMSPMERCFWRPNGYPSPSWAPNATD